MGYQTPNIDRVAKEGVTFTDYYAQQSCTAGRACFITGQNPIRTGLTKVGMRAPPSDFKRKTRPLRKCSSRWATPPASSARTIWATADEFLPTMHGFDESLATYITSMLRKKPELPDYPKDPEFEKRFGPRGVLHCVADGKGGQTITDTGSLTKKRMETVDER